MKTHPEPEQLSAYLDGEVDAAERAQIDAHVRTCSECSATLTGLRATLADLRELPSPTPSDQESWALRSALVRARKRPSRQYQRWVTAAGSVAAVAIVLLAISLNGQTTSSTFGPTSNVVQGGEAATGGAGTSLISVQSTNYNQTSAANLVDIASRNATTFGATQGTTRDSTASGGTPAALAPGPVTAPQTKSATDYLPKIQSCEKEIFKGDSRVWTPLQYIVARYNKVPVFLLLYSIGSGADTKTELWVVQRTDCYPLLNVPAH
jgi:hypothetical protein